MPFVPVVSSSGKPLMPCHPARARELVRKGKAIRQFDRGIFFIRLTERSDGVTQDVVVGIDPGSKKEGLTVKSASHAYLNSQHSGRRRDSRQGSQSRSIGISSVATIPTNAVPATPIEPGKGRSAAIHQSQVAVEAPFAELAASPVPDLTGRG